MRIVIDGDGCPVVKQSIEIAKKYKIECIILCDTSHNIVSEYAKTIVVSKGADSVDFALVNMISSEDIVVTQDYGLAAMCLAKRAIIINQDGMRYDEYNIEGLLNARHKAQKIRRSGGRLRGSTKRTTEQNNSFVEKITEIIAVNIK